MNVAVVGAGAAGIAAAWSAARAGARVTVVHSTAGATALYSGALDYDPWPELTFQHALDSRLLSLVTALGAWSLSTQPRFVATDCGVVRAARGSDPALLDLTPHAGGTIGVVRSDWLAYDAHLLALALGHSQWATETKTRFLPLDVPLIVPEERACNPFDLAERHDQPERLAALSERLNGVSQSVDAWLFGPCLGTSPGAAERLSELVGKPCGETTSPPGGPAGARFESAALELLGAIDVIAYRDRIARIERVGGHWELSGRDTQYEADSVILAHGGMVAGGIVLDVDRKLGTARFHCAIDAPVHAALDGKILHIASSLHGLDVHALGIGVLERVGLFARGLTVPDQPGLFIAGSALADRPRSVLRAAETGIQAGALAAQ